MFSKLATTTITALALSMLVSAAPAQLQKRDVSIVERCVNQNQVALTFDDGPYQYEQDIANRLSDAGSKGTFFLNGNSG
jgi:peptidoglycan/xylan/chitin deacetylase (PgdA/CDA1 family)